jgi:hypothetical protein
LKDNAIIAAYPQSARLKPINTPGIPSDIFRKDPEMISQSIP